MQSWRKRFLACALALLVFAGLWAFYWAPALLRSSGNFGELVYETDGNSLETFPGTPVYTRYVEIHRAVPRAAADGGTWLDLTATVYRLPSGELAWKQDGTVGYDPETLKVVGHDAHVVFPPHVQPADYRVKFFSYLPDGGVPFRFRGAETLRGLRVYVFDFAADDLDWTANYTLALPPGVRIKSRDWGTVWIEPTTGTLVNHKEEWVAWADGGAFQGVEVDSGSMWLSDDTLMKQVFLAQNMKRASILYEIVLPLTMVGIAAILLAMAAVRGNRGLG